MNSRPLAYAAVRLLLVLALLLALGQVAQRALVEALAPVWHRTTTWLDPDFRLEGIGLTNTQGERSLQARLAVNRYMVVGRKVYEPGAHNRGQASIPFGTVWATLCIFVAVLLVWPRVAAARPWLAWALRVVLGAVVLALLLATLAPIELLGHMRSAVLADAGNTDWYFIESTARFLGAGGRVLVPLVAGALCCLLADAVARRLCGTDQTD